MALNNLQPNHAGCGSNIRVQAGGTFSTISCYVSGTVQVSPSQPATLSFDKPAFIYDSGYCILLNTGKQTKIIPNKEFKWHFFIISNSYLFTKRINLYNIYDVYYICR